MAETETSLDLSVIIHTDHATLDSKCVEIWKVIWPVLNSDSPSPSSSISQKCFQKILFNYGKVHQLPRLFRRLLDALQELQKSGVLSDRISSAVFRGFDNVLKDASEQHLVNILEILLKELETIGISSTTVSASLFHVIIRLLWINCHNVTVKPHTRPETVQNLSRIWMEIQERLLIPLSEACSTFQNAKLDCSFLIALHAWIGIVPVLKDRVALEDQEAYSFARKMTKIVKEQASTLGEENIASRYWLHKITWFCWTSLDNLDLDNDEIEAELFPWDHLKEMEKGIFWDGNIFQIDSAVLPIALWESVCDFYSYLPESVTRKQHSKMAELLVEHLCAFDLNASSPTANDFVGAVSVSQKLFKNTLIEECIGLKKACTTQLQKYLRNILEDHESSQQPKKKKQKSDRKSVDPVTALSSALLILRELGTDDLELEGFSVTLIWKAFEFIIHRNSSSWNQTKLIPIFSAFMGIICAIRTEDKKYWMNTLSDLLKLKTKLFQRPVDSSQERSKLVSLWHSYEVYVVSRLLDCNQGLESVTQLISEASSIEGTLPASILFAFSKQIHRPGMIAAFYDLLPRITKFYEDLLRGNFSEDRDEFGELIGITAHVLRTSLRILAKVDSSKSRLEQARSSLLSAASIVAISDILTAEFVSRNPSEVLEHAALSFFLADKCKTKLVRQTLSCLVGTTDNLVEKEDAEEMDGNLNGLSDQELFDKLSEQVSRLNVPQRSLSSGASKLPVIARARQQWKECLTEMLWKVESPEKTLKFLEKSITDFGGRCGIVESELEFYHLLYECHAILDTFPDAIRLREPIYARLCFMATFISKQVSFANRFLDLLRKLLHPPEVFMSDPLMIARLALSAQVFRVLDLKSLDLEQYSELHRQTYQLLQAVVSVPRFIGPQTVHLFVAAASVWLSALMRWSRQETGLSDVKLKRTMIKNANLVPRLFTTVSNHKQQFAKLGMHILATYCYELQHGALFPEVKEHIVAGLYRLLDITDIHSKSMANAMISVELKETFRNLVENHLKFHKYRGMV